MNAAVTTTWVRKTSLVIALALMSLGAWTAAAEALPNSMDALGDSVTQAFNTCKVEFTDCPENSWATGTDSLVKSYYERAVAVNSSLAGHEHNDAVSGSKMSELNAQATTAVSRGVELVGILMGNNDACTSSVSTMTTKTTFESQFKTALTTISSGLPSALIKVGSLANAYRLWEILHTNASAVSTWNTLKICQSLLANPTSTAPADVTRRKEVRTREEEYDSALSTVCSHVTHCEFDANAGFNTLFTTSDVSTRDYFHPTIAGQALIAEVAWGALPY